MNQDTAQTLATVRNDLRAAIEVLDGVDGLLKDVDAKDSGLDTHGMCERTLEALGTLKDLVGAISFALGDDNDDGE